MNFLLFLFHFLHSVHFIYQFTLAHSAARGKECLATFPIKDLWTHTISSFYYTNYFCCHRVCHSIIQLQTCCTNRWLKLPSILFLWTSNTSPRSSDVEPSDHLTILALLSFISFPSSSFRYLHRIVFST